MRRPFPEIASLARCYCWFSLPDQSLSWSLSNLIILDRSKSEATGVLTKRFSCKKAPVIPNTNPINVNAMIVENVRSNQIPIKAGTIINKQDAKISETFDMAFAVGERSSTRLSKSSDETTTKPSLFKGRHQSIDDLRKPQDLRGNFVKFFSKLTQANVIKQLTTKTTRKRSSKHHEIKRKPLLKNNLRRTTQVA